MKTIFRFLVLLTIKLLVRLLYKTEVTKIGSVDQNQFRGINVALVLNHTSLFEPMYISACPTKFLWEIASRGLFPGADITMDRPFAGRLIKLLARDAVSITRQRDDSWQQFLNKIDRDAMVLMAPEGRMKRPNGLDKNGKAMTVRGGVADVLDRIVQGKMLLVYSGGLHHIQSPGQKFPKLFKTIAVGLEVVDIAEYKQIFLGLKDSKAVRVEIARDLEKRRDRHCPPLEAKFKLHPAI
jgi:1-acyl-sn-glycerol-3-phosphate acyltransferase